MGFSYKINNNMIVNAFEKFFNRVDCEIFFTGIPKLAHFTRMLDITPTTEQQMQKTFYTIKHTMASRKWFYNAGRTLYLLADGSIAGKDVGILEHCQVRRRVRRDFQDTTPLGKPCTILVVFGTATRKPVQPYQQ